MGEPVHGAPQPPTSDRGYEHSDVPIRPVAIFLAGLTIMLIVAGGLTAGLFWWFEAKAVGDDPAPTPLAAGATETPGPLLQVSPRQDLEQMRKGEEARLNTAGWVDKDQGVARIPIESAIAVTAKQGLPDWPAAEATGESAVGANGDVQEPAARTPQGSGQQSPVDGGNEQ